MIKHLAGCKKRAAAGASKERVFHLRVECPYDRRYWLHLEAPQTTTLRALDEFLRDVWLECCGHMSAFRIDGQGYSAPQPVREVGDRSMDVKLGDVLAPGTAFDYEYDFGSTTELTLTVLGLGVPAAARGSVRLLARNEAQLFACAACGAPASELCADECLWEGGPDGAALCKACSSKHEHDEDMRLPIVNSPRMGVCAYTG
jgi:hypothetical protein